MPLPVAHGRSAPDAGGPWLALDAGASPALRVRALLREWEHRVIGAGVNGVRGTDRRLVGALARRGSRPVREPARPERRRSGRRVRALGRAPHLAEAAPLIRDRVGGIVHASDHMIVVSDAAGVLLRLGAIVRATAASCALPSTAPSA